MPGTNLIVFRDNAKKISRKELTPDLQAAMNRLRSADSQCTVDALVLAGQLESSLSDCASPSAARSSVLTDVLAQFFLEGSVSEFDLVDSICKDVLSSGLPEEIVLTEAEGFAYYALHPADFADAIRTRAYLSPVALIGIRSIGTALSAVAMAQLRRQQTPASRITVRPTGHPYDRKTHFTVPQAEWVDQNNACGSTFLVLDEGPGLSGSSFLSVAESLVDRGVPPDRITMVGTRECGTEQLSAPNAVRRWNRFGWQKVSSRIYRRFSDATFLGAGQWRDWLLAPQSERPACWPEMESLRFLVSDRNFIVKFEGFGRAGKQTLERGQAICRAGFGPRVESVGDGMHSYSFIPGQPLSVSELSSGLLDWIAKYCAFRDHEMKGSEDAGNQLREMVEFNLLQVTGAPITLPADCLKTHSPIFVDGRMQPHEWIWSKDGYVAKVDAVQHGDDHFLPGPTDIAWDLAGAIVEWNLDDAGAHYLQERLSGYAGRNLTDRLPYFLLAYSTFRCAYCTMAAQATENPIEHVRLQRSSRFYRCKMQSIQESVSGLLHQ